MPHPEYIKRWSTQSVLSKVYELIEAIGSRGIHVDLSELEELLVRRDHSVKEMIYSGELRVPERRVAVGLPLQLRREVVRRAVQGLPRPPIAQMAQQHGIHTARLDNFIYAIEAWLSPSSSTRWDPKGLWPNGMM